MSVDRGATWSGIGETTSAGGFFGMCGMTSDSAGGVHLLQVTSLGGTPLVHQFWDGRYWSWPVPVVMWAAGAPSHASDSDVAVGLGNELHVVVEQMSKHDHGESSQVREAEPSLEGQSPAAYGWVYDVFYLHSTADAPRVEPQSLDPSAVVPAPTLVPEVSITVQPTQVEPTKVVALEPVPDTAYRAGETTVTMLTSVLPPLVLVVGFVALRLLQKRPR
jgi:hypothetical protein